MFNIIYGSVLAKKINWWGLNFFRKKESFKGAFQFCPDHFIVEYTAEDRVSVGSPIVDSFDRMFEVGWRLLEV